ASAHDRLQALENGGQVGTPDVASVDNTERQHELLGRSREHSVELLRSAHEVKVETSDRQAKCQIEIVTERTEIGRQHELQFRQRVREEAIGLAECVARRFIDVEYEARFVDLYPIGAVRHQTSKHLNIDWKQFADERYGVERWILALAELQIGNWTEQDGTCLVAERLCLA